MTAYRKLWKGFSHFFLKDAPKTVELEIRHEHEVLYFGGAQVSTDNFSTAATGISDYSFLILTARTMDETFLRTLYQAGYTDPHKNPANVVDWAELCLTLCPEGDFVLRRYIGRDGSELILDLFMDQKYADWFR